MAESNPSPSSAAVAATSSSPLIKENREKVESVMADLDKSQSELGTKLQSLRQDVQSWRSKLDTQVRTYKTELSRLKSSLNTELEQLRFEFQELRMTLQQQEDDVTNSLKNLGIGNVSKDTRYIKRNEEKEKAEDWEVISRASSGDSNGKRD